MEEKIKRIEEMTPEFYQEFYGQWVNLHEYKIYSPTEFYLMLRSKTKGNPLLSIDDYKGWGGWWLAEFIDHQLTNYWRFDFRQEANYWKRQKEETNGKAEIGFPKDDNQ